MENDPSAIAKESVDQKKRKGDLLEFFLDKKTKKEEEDESVAFNGEQGNCHESNTVTSSKFHTDKGNHNGKFLGVRYENGWGIDKAKRKPSKHGTHSLLIKGNTDRQLNLSSCYPNGFEVDKRMEEAAKWYRHSADQGNADSKWKDMKEAVKWYTLSAEQGNADGQCGLGICYERGYGVDKDMKEAVKWYRLSAEQGNADGQCSLGFCYEHGYGVDKDMKEAVKWYRHSAEQGNADGQCSLGVCYYNGYGVAKDMNEAFEWFKLSADQGNARGHFGLGICYENGYGVDQDMKEAVKWYRLSAEQGYASGQCGLGICYENGHGVDKDIQEALKWYRLSAEQGNAYGQCSLGLCYKYGYVVDKHMKESMKYMQEAVKWFRLSAEQGYASGQSGLGICYLMGNGVDKDMNEAFKWFKLSGEQGNLGGQCGLGFCYLHGYGVDQDLKEAVKWYKLAADQGENDSFACWFLGDCYYYGLGVERNQSIAFSYYQKAIMMNPNCIQEMYGSNDEFEKGEYLGNGYAGCVYKAVIKPDKKPAACKEIIFTNEQVEAHDEKYLLDILATKSTTSRTRALMEGKILSLAPTHPNVIKTYTFHLLQDRMYLLMELADFSLHDVIYKNFKDLLDINKYRVNFTHQIAMGMKVLHDANILHADLKSSNVLIKREGNEYYAKVADFGLSSLTKLMDVDILPQKYITAHAYISSPERITTIEQFPFIKSKVEHMCKKCDVYSFAMVMYELVTQKDLASIKFHPSHYVHYQCPDPEQMDYLISIRSGLRPALPPVEENESAKSHYFDLIKKCWNHNPESRPEFGEIAEYIEKYLRIDASQSELKFQEFCCVQELDGIHF